MDTTPQTQITTPAPGSSDADGCGSFCDRCGKEAEKVTHVGRKKFCGGCFLPAYSEGQAAPWQPNAGSTKIDERSIAVAQQALIEAHKITERVLGNYGPRDANALWHEVMEIASSLSKAMIYLDIEIHNPYRGTNFIFYKNPEPWVQTPNGTGAPTWPT